MNDNSCQQPRLISWYRRFLEDGKSAAFVRVVASRYTLSTLQRLTTSADHDLRRATVLALGMLAGGESIPVVGRRLCDKDRCVRLVAEVAFSDLTRREMGVEAGQALDQARRHIGGERYETALCRGRGGNRPLTASLTVSPGPPQRVYQPLRPV